MGVIPVFPGNPRQKHQFIVRIDGFDAAWFESADIPEIEVERDEFNPAGSVRSTKFAGRVKYGDAVLKKGMPSDSADFAAWSWLKTEVDAEKGELGDPASYKKDIEIVHVNRVGTPVQTWLLMGAWVTKVKPDENSGGSSEHMLETVTLSVDEVRQS